MSAVMMPGGPGCRRGVRRPRAARRQAHRRWPHAGSGHGADRRRRALGALRRDEDAEGRGARVQQPPRAPACRRHHRARPSTRCRRSTPTRPSTPCSCSTRRRPRSTSTPSCWPSTRTRTSTGCTPPTSGRLALGIPGPVACTPAGIEALLAHYEVPVAGRDVVIVGRGITIGRPLSILLSQKRPTANAAVTVGAHRRRRLGRAHAAGRHPRSPRPASRA